MDERVEAVPVDLGDGVVMLAETRVPARTGEQEVVSLTKTLDGVTDAVQRVGQGLVGAMKAVGPKKFSIEMGFELSMKEGKLVALLVNGSGSASIKITLEWEQGKADAAAGG